MPHRSTRTDEVAHRDAEGDPHILGPGLLPTPFTAAEIRVASEGKVIRLLVEDPDGSRFERVNRFCDRDAEGATLEQWRVDADGAVEGPIARARVTWRELQEHAAFSAATTTRSTETLELPIGRVDCLRYAVRKTADPEASTFWFSLGHPGMPVRYEVATDTGIQRTTVIAIERR